MNNDFLHHNSISLQGLKAYNKNIYFYIDTLTQNITTNQCKHWPFLLILHLYFNKYAWFKGIQVKTYCTYTLLTQNITTNQCKHWPFLLLLHHNSINIKGLKVYK